jgi:hypothetical protein
MKLLSKITLKNIAGKISFAVLMIVVSILSPVLGRYLFAQTEQKYDYYKVVETRNVFKPLWNVITDDEVQRKKREEELQLEDKKRKEEEQARLDELKKRDEESAMQMKKSEIENTVVMSGIVFFGGQNRALLEDKRGRGGSSMYAVGDSIRDMTVESIDDTKKEVVLNYKGKMKITLRLSK